MRHDASNRLALAVLGATGATGRHVVTNALARGHRVVALVRRPGSLAPAPGLREHLWADLADAAGLGAALAGVDAVISTLGGAEKGPTSVCTEAMRSTVPAMAAAGVKRLIVVSAHGVLETHDSSLYSKAVWAGVADRMRDKESMEPLITASGLDWTIVRPPKLSEHAANGKYATGTDTSVRLWSSIGRADLADFLLDEAEVPRYTRAHPRITR
ncbi:putative NADH-flavin reductase [Nocardioides aurantiacus]|uniref:Putative NADH-flavin reductase n=2 Tax=Nocardioides aurantiacus TaxID=86796 RepID=A0A3N2CU68_9ACTN|nr:NAD(P)H-binding protein [Nocardioides aurantiacus]ROR91083.1 putative NADH-flavin reductase [Nocardioides aurantiacus]